jgi:hypothetical protein
MSYWNMTIATAIYKIRSDELVLPAIQRRFVWAPERMYSYFDSLMRGYPTGVLLFWNTTQRVQYRKFIKVDTPDLKLAYHIKDEGRRGTMVLDGQQRLQSLYLALEGGLDGRTFYFDVLGSGFDHPDTSEAKYRFQFLAEREAASRNERRKGSQFWISFHKVLECKDVAQRRQLVRWCIKYADISNTSEEAARLGENIEIAYSKLKAEPLLNHYTIDPNYGEDSDATPIEEILEIFVRINSGGQVLSRSDLMFSLMQLNWEDAGEYIDEVLDDINSTGNFDFDRDFVLRCALVCCGKGARFDVSKLRDTETIRQIEEQFPRVAHALAAFVDFLVSDAKILDRRILGSYSSVIPFVFFIFLQEDQELRGELVRRDIKNALYLSLMTSVFSRWSDSRIDGVIREVFNAPYSRLRGAFPLADFRAFVERREGRERIDDWLLQQNVTLLLNMLEGGTVLPLGRRRYRPEVDHIFPRSKLLQADFAADEADHFANFRLISKPDNIWKSDTDPRPYFEAHPGVAEHYLIPVELLDYERYPEFLLVRRKRIWNRVKEFLGLTEDEMPPVDRIAPGDENAAIDQLELGLRSLIGSLLTETNDERYWKRAIPSQTQQNVKQRIEQHLVRYPDLSWANFASGESRLAFCDMSDYGLIILARNNWPAFTPIFKSRNELERHLTSVTRLRNSVKHGRAIDLVERLSGEAGILWLRRALDIDIASSDTEEPIPGGEPTEDDYRRLLTRIPVPYGQRQLYRALYFAEGNALIHDDLIAGIPGSNDGRLAGIMGGLGGRINGTPGFGKTHRPGRSMVVYWDKVDDGRWRLNLRPGMQAALEVLSPDWLVPPDASD